MDHEKSVYQANAVSFAFSQGKNQGTPGAPPDLNWAKTRP